MEYQQPHAAAPPYPTTIVGPQYCCPHPVDLSIVRKVMSLADKFTVTDVNGNVVFKLKTSLMTLRESRVLLDASHNPILTLRRKIMTMHDRWQAFRGESKDPNDLIFTLQRSSLFQLRTKLDVFLAGNTTKQVCDFKVKGSLFEGSCVVYAGESNTIVAKMHKKNTVQSITFGKTNLMVTVYPNIDYAFIVALILTLDAILTPSNNGGGASS